MDLFGHIGQLLAAAGNALTAHHQTVQQTVPGHALQPANNNPQSAALGYNAYQTGNFSPQGGGGLPNLALAHGHLANLHAALAGNPNQLQAPGGYNHFQPAYGNPQDAPMGSNQYQSGVFNPQGGGAALPNLRGQIQMPQLRMLQLYSNLGLQGNNANPGYIPLQNSGTGGPGYTANLQPANHNPQVRNYSPQK